MIRTLRPVASCIPDRRRSGFTLVEVLLVVVIVGLAAGLGGGLYLGSYKRMMVEKAARDIWLMAKYARIAAIEQQQTLQLLVDKTNRRFWLATTETQNEDLKADPGVVYNRYCKPLELPTGVEIEAISIGTAVQDDMGEDTRPRIVFRPNGTAESASIGIGDGNTHYGITICGATGVVRLAAGKVARAADLAVDLEAR